MHELDLGSPPLDGHERGKRRRIAEILAAARELLNEQAADEVTTSRIAARAGVAPMTIFNLIGTRDDLWAAIAAASLTEVSHGSSEIEDARERAHAIADQFMSAIISEAPVWRALISSWRDSGRVLEGEPTGALLSCFDDAVDQGHLSHEVDIRRLVATILSGFVGAAHQWAAGLISDRGMRRRASDLVDLALAAGRPDGPPPMWPPGS
ncbi:TetR/AcrR family transcriptional regulator [Aeromicrobium fastidiosum]|uniref:TetR/AcrR family transcriptional regulator n=1 Tax=Aeromicrobium fastidiosum TaxID=52699 RepID=A0A641AP81_9ACTN|nr:TetR/AcrR family transcriptional regulator [Aeromicrobium fastidiosum]KAA1379904.1 TetR/AcrR family transcriptional regulator [Aeromicrobium fastidiosum]MBP2389410.1 AcrR family transcriptional regulator [Aeromicrobium fastidiosum]